MFREARTILAIALLGGLVHLAGCQSPTDLTQPVPTDVKLKLNESTTDSTTTGNDSGTKCDSEGTQTSGTNGETQACPPNHGTGGG